jgi:signal peptidase I
VKPHRGDVIVFRSNIGNHFIKRIIAAAGDVVDISDDGIVYINGARLEEPYVVNEDRTKPAMDFPFEVPPGTVFVLNDNRPIVDDSRETEFGPVPNSQIVGKAIIKLWPLDQFGTALE